MAPMEEEYNERSYRHQYVGGAAESKSSDHKIPKNYITDF